MKYWWLSDFRRLAEEKAGVEALSAESWFALEEWTIDEGRLAVDAAITARGAAYLVRLVFPDQFPLVPAWVEPREPARWSSHQYGDGVLCLQLRPDNWRASFRGADLLRSAYDLLHIENPEGDGEKSRAPSAHNIGDVQAYEWGANPVLIGAGCDERVRSGAGNDLLALRFMSFAGIWPIVIHDGEDRRSVRRPPGTDIEAWRFELPVFVSQSAAKGAIPDRAVLIAAAALDPERAIAAAECTAGVLLLAGGEKIRAFHLTTDGDAFERHVFVLPDQEAARSGRASTAKRVALVGAGSVGSKIAETLMRSGVSTMTLIDGDVMLPVNIERHALDWRDVGFRKADGLRRLLLNIAPGADIKVIDQNLNWQRSAETHAWQVDEIAACDVIVDATGDAATALFLGAIAAANRRPFVSVEVYEGGIGALVASSVPGRDPAFEAARASFLAWCDQQEAPRPASGVKRYEALTEEGEPLVADDAAVSVAASHAARVILDLVDEAPSEAASAWLLLGLKRAWVFAGHGHNIHLDVGPGSTPPADEDDEGARAFATELVRAYVDARKSGE